MRTVLILLVGLCLVGVTALSGGAAPPREPRWHNCGPGPAETFPECATLSVPADWREPQGATTGLGLARLAARDPANRVGTVVVNLGGPGPTIFPGSEEPLRELTETHDVIVFDPRGIGTSSPITCSDEPDYTALLFDIDRSTWSRFAKEHREWGERCLTTAGPLAGHLDAWQVAHDLEAIRAAVGTDRLTYYGNSYGTVYGQRYADLFPDRVGRMFLDSVADHTETSPLRRTLPMAQLYQERFDRFAAWCAGSDECAVSPRDPREVFDRLLERAEREPLPAPGAGAGRTVTADQLRIKALGAVDVESRWAGFAAALVEAERGDAGDLWLATPDRRPGTAVNLAFCADFPYRAGWSRMTRTIERPLREVAPRTGWLAARFFYGRCVGLPQQGNNPPRPITAAGVAPILLLNGADDDTTPPAGGRNVARQLPGSVWFTADAGHAAYYSGQRCVRDIVHRYFASGDLPEPGHRCR